MVFVTTIQFYDAMKKRKEEDQKDSLALDVFVDLLSRKRHSQDDQPRPSESQTEAVKFVYQDRVQTKRLTLANLDRTRPASSNRGHANRQARKQISDTQRDAHDKHTNGSKSKATNDHRDLDSVRTAAPVKCVIEKHRHYFATSSAESLSTLTVSMIFFLSMIFGLTMRIVC